MNYGRIVSRAWEITWRHKVLWVFGILAALFGAGGGGGGGSGSPGIQLDRSSLEGLQRRFPGLDLERLAAMIVPLLGALLVFGLIMLIVGIIVRYTSEGALVGMVDEVERTDETSFRSGLNQGWRRFLRLFAIDILIGIAVAVVVFAFVVVALIAAAIAAGPLVLLAQSESPALVVGVIWVIVAGLALLALIIALALALGALITLVREFAFRAAVLEDRGVFASIGDGWSLATGNLRHAGLMWLLLFGIQLALGILGIPLVLIAVFAIGVPIALLGSAAESVALVLLIGIPALLLLSLALLLVGGVYQVFTSGVWTLTYRELRTPPVAAVVSPEI